MSTNVDDRIVRMQLDSTGFEAGALKALNTLDKLDSALKMDGAAAGLDEVRKNISNFNMDSVSNAVETTQSHFSKWGAFVSGVFFKLGSEAVDYGAKLVKNIGNALTKSARDGFTEYEQQMKSVQTISANSGASLKVIQQNLDELNAYADKTSYVFSDMTSAIGRFTAAGLDVNSSTKAIQGFFNAAALSGASAQDASRGVYQLSQAMSAGVVKLQDWKSIENASIDTEKFRDIIMLTAKHMGVADDNFKEAAAGTMSFRESLASGWLTADVMQEALENLTMSTLDFEDAEEGTKQLMEELTQNGYTEEQAKQIIGIATAADQSAREIRTFSQMMETMGESMGSGWAKTWQLIIGDYKQSAEFFTWLSGRFSSIIDASAEARNNLLKDWQAAGGRDALVGIVANLFEAVTRIITPIKDAFTDVFSIGGEQLAVLTENFAVFTEGLVINGETMTKINEAFHATFMIFHGLFGILGNGVRIVTTIVSSFMRGFNSMQSVASSFGSFLEPIAHFINHLHVLSDTLEDFIANSSFLNTLVSWGEDIHVIIWDVVDVISAAIKVFISFAKGMWSITRPLREIAATILSSFGKNVVSAIDFFITLLYNTTGAISKFATGFSEYFSKIFRYVSRIYEDIYYVLIGFVNAFSETFGSPILNTIGTWIDKIKGFFSELIPSFSIFDGGIGETVVKWLADLAEVVHSFSTDHRTEFFKEWFASVSKTAGGPFLAVFSAVQNVFAKLADIVSGPLSSAFSWLKDTFFSIISANPLSKISEIFESIKASFGSFEFVNPFSGIGNLFSSVSFVNPFANFKIPKNITSQLSKLKKKFKELGKSTDDATWSIGQFIKQAGTKIATSGKDRLLGFINSLNDTWNNLKAYFKELSSNGNSFGQNVKQIFSDIYRSLTEWTGRIASESSGLAGTIAGAFNWILVKLEGLPDLFKSLFSTTKTSVEEGAKSVKDGAEKFQKDQKTLWSTIFDKLPSIDDVTKSLSGFFSGIKDRIAQGFKNLFVGNTEADTGLAKASMADLFDFSSFKITFPDITTPFTSLVDQFSAALDRLPEDKMEAWFGKGGHIETWSKTIGSVFLWWNGNKWLSSLSKLNKGLGKQGEGIGDFFSKLPDAVKDGVKGLGQAFGEGIGGQFKAGMDSLSKGMENFGKSFSPFKQSKAKSFLQIAEGIIVLAGALWVLSRVPADDLERSADMLLKIGLASAALTLFAGWLAETAKLDLSGVGKAMAGIGIGLLAAAGAIWVFTQVSKDPAIVVGMQNFKIVLELLVGATSILLAISALGGSLKGVASVLIALTAAIGISLIALHFLGTMDGKEFIVGSSRLKSLGTFFTLASGLLLTISALGGHVGLGTALAIGALVAAITAAIIPIKILGKTKDNEYIVGESRLKSLGTFFALAASLISLVAQHGVGALFAATAMIPFTLAISLAIIPIKLLSKLTEAEIDKGLTVIENVSILFAGLIAFFGLVTMNLLSIAGAAIGLTLLVIPITAMAAVVAALSWVAHQDIAAMESAMWAFTGIIAGIAAISLSAVFTGTALIAFAVGLTLTAGALILLASAINAIDFETFNSSLVGFAESMGQAGAAAITGFIGGIANSLGEALSAGVQMAGEFLKGLKGPKGIDSNSPSKATEEAGEFAGEGFINGIANYFSQIFGSGEETGTNFMDGLSDLPNSLATKASEAITTFIDNLDTTEIINKGNEITAGLIEGIKSNAWNSLTAIPGEIFNAITTGICDLFGIKSPSTYMKDEIGANIIQGLIDGLMDGSLLSSLGTAALGLVDTIKNGLVGLGEGFVNNAITAGSGLVTTIGSYAGGAATAAGNLVKNTASGLSTLVSTMTGKANEGAGGFVKGVGSQTTKAKTTSASYVTSVKTGLSTLASSMRTSGVSGADSFVGGLSTGESRARNAAASMAHAAQRGASGYSLYSTGQNLADGFALGIARNAYKAEQEANRMAAAVVRKTRLTTEVKSPSRVFMRIGGYLAEGLAIGIRQNTNMAVDASENMANAVSNLSFGLDDILETDYNPVITPVIDPTQFNYNLSNLSSSLNTRLTDSLVFGNLNYTGEITAKLDDYNSINKQAIDAIAENQLDYNLLGISVANALIASGVEVKIDGGGLMGYLAGEIQDVRRMYRS